MRRDHRPKYGFCVTRLSLSLSLPFNELPLGGWRKWHVAQWRVICLIGWVCVTPAFCTIGLWLICPFTFAIHFSPSLIGMAFSRSSSLNFQFTLVYLSFSRRTYDSPSSGPRVPRFSLKYSPCLWLTTLATLSGIECPIFSTKCPTHWNCNHEASRAGEGDGNEGGRQWTGSTGSLSDQWSLVAV